MLLILAAIVSLDLAGYLWFRSLCQNAIRTHVFAVKQLGEPNLIPFERGLLLRQQKAQQVI